MAGSETAKSVSYYRQLLEELDYYASGPTMLSMDNKANINLAYNGLTEPAHLFPSLFPSLDHPSQHHGLTPRPTSNGWMKNPIPHSTACQSSCTTLMRAQCALSCDTTTPTSRTAQTCAVAGWSLRSDTFVTLPYSGGWHPCPQCRALLSGQPPLPRPPRCDPALPGDFISRGFKRSPHLCVCDSKDLAVLRRRDDRVAGFTLSSKREAHVASACRHCGGRYPRPHAAGARQLLPAYLAPHFPPPSGILPPGARHLLLVDLALPSRLSRSDEVYFGHGNLDARAGVQRPVQAGDQVYALCALSNVNASHIWCTYPVPFSEHGGSCAGAAGTRSIRPF